MPNCIVTVTRPVLTEEEKQKRMEELKKATAEFMEVVNQRKEHK